jgi:hypothetical protein
MLNWLRRLLDHEGYEERLRVEGRRAVARKLDTASWWFGEDPALASLLRDIAHEVAYFGSFDEDKVRDRWRALRAKPAKDQP